MQVNILEYREHKAILLPLLAFQYNEDQMETNTFSLLIDDIPWQTYNPKKRQQNKISKKIIQHLKLYVNNIIIIYHQVNKYNKL